MKPYTRISGIFSSGMVLQRNAVNIISGTESSVKQVTAEIEGAVFSSKVERGKFSISLPPQKAGIGKKMIISGSEQIILEDICFGDVFMLSGQSNMELPIARVRDESADEIDRAAYPYIRQYRLTASYEFDETAEIELPRAPWTKALPGQIEQMSAAGFFFAKKIYERLKVPIGLILNAQGGSSIEAWMPMQDLDRWGNYRNQIDAFMKRGSLHDFLQEREARITKWYEEVRSIEGVDTFLSPPQNAEEFDVPSLFPAASEERFSGSIWFYRSFELANEPGAESLLYLGELIDSDDTYVNGVWVGQTGYRYPPRKYYFDGSILKKGTNQIAVRLVIQNGKGGFIPQHPYFLETGSERIALDGSWTYSIERKAQRDCNEGFLAQKLPTGLFRSAILPLRDTSMKGILWYQGESNTGEPEQYDQKFKVMVETWRTVLNQNLPIICVELADYIDPINGIEPGWAVIQRMQRLAPEHTDRCAVVSAKDLGAPFELHPQYKSELGKRLADKALDMIYA